MPSTTPNGSDLPRSNLYVIEMPNGRRERARDRHLPKSGLLVQYPTPLTPRLQVTPIKTAKPVVGVDKYGWQYGGLLRR